MIDILLQNALDLRRAGKLAEAAQLYAGILKREPEHFEALHALGIMHYQSGRFDDALRLMGEALRVNPLAADAFYNRGSLLAKLNRLEEAISSFDRAIALNPNYVEALVNRGTSSLRLGRAAEGLAAFEKVVRLRPDLPQAWASLGGAALALQRPEQALASFDRALSLRADVAHLWKDRASALVALQRQDEALASLERAIKLEPKNAETLYRRADLLQWQRRLPEAVLAYDALLSVDPGSAEAWNHRGIALIELKRQAEALASFDRAVGLEPRNVDAVHNRANVLFELKRFDEAARDYAAALRLEPDLPYAEGFLIQCRMRVCDWRNLAADRQKLRAALAAGKTIIDPQGNLAISESPEDQLQCARIAMAEEPPRAPLWRGERYAHDRIRVAYLTADFRPHPVAFLIAGVFEHHDKTCFETIGISLRGGADSDIRARIEAGFEKFIDAHTMAEAETAALLRRMEVDIAVDLMGFTEDSRPGILAQRPAPTQVNFLGFPGTMGATHIDYILAHRTLIRSDEHRFYSERVVYLPDTYQATDSKRVVAANTPTRGQMGLPEEGFVFCCFNNNYKIGPESFAIWMRLLRAVPGSVLWLLKDNDSVAANLKREAQAWGLDAERLVFAERVLPAEHLARQRLADLFLDTTPYGAHTTCSDALFVGLPVISFLGPTFAARVAANLLAAIGLPELVTDTKESYERLALHLARDSEALAAVKSKLARNRLTHPLFDTARFTRHLESAFTTMVKRQRQGLPPETFAVEGIS